MARHHKTRSAVVAMARRRVPDVITHGKRRWQRTGKDPWVSLAAWLAERPDGARIVVYDRAADVEPYCDIRLLPDDSGLALGGDDGHGADMAGNGQYELMALTAQVQGLRELLTDIRSTALTEIRQEIRGVRDDLARAVERIVDALDDAVAAAQAAAPKSDIATDVTAALGALQGLGIDLGGQRKKRRKREEVAEDED